MALEQSTATVIAASITGFLGLCGTIITISVNRKKTQQFELEKEKMKASKEIVLKKIAESSKDILRKIEEDQKILLARATSNSADFAKEIDRVFESEKEIVAALLESEEGVVSKPMPE